MKVIAKKNRELALINAQNTQNENRAETITLVVPEEYEDYNKKIVFITDDGTVWDVITNNEYKITNAITKYKQVDFYIWLTKEVDGESIDFRTKTKTLSFYHNEDASDEITDEEIHGVNTVVNLLEEEIEKVENLNIEATKIGDTTTVTITKKDGTTESVEINDGVDGQDGQDGYTPQKGIDYFTEQDIEEIETDVKNDIEENVLVNYSLTAETGAKIELSINTTDYKLKAILKDKNNNIIHTSNVIDLPLETMVVNATYDNVNKVIILTLQNGTTVSISVADLVSGLVSESQLQTILSNYYTKTEINNLLNNKVDKVQGKELSSNDFTDTLKEKLEGLENYDDTEIKADIEKLQTENARLKATLPTTGEVTGQDITLDKTAEFEFKKPPLPMGNSEQEGEPSPDNEIPITNVTGDVEVVVENKNLFDKTIFKTIFGDIGFDISKLKIGEQYTFSSNLPITIFKISNFSSNYNSVIAANNNGFTTFTFTMSRNIQIPETATQYLFIGFQGYNFVNNINDLANYNMQIEKSSTATAYVPHQEQKFIFPLGNEKLMLGDYLADDGIHHVRGQVELNQNNIGVVLAVSTYNSKSLATIQRVQLGMIKNYNVNTALISTYKEETNLSNIASGKFSTTADNTSIWIFDDRFTDLATARNLLLGTIIEFEFAQEVIVPYTSAQQEVYNQIKQALSYEEQTNIIGTSDGSNPIFSVKAYQNTKLVLEERNAKYESLEARVALLE